MAKTAVEQWDTTAANNTEINSIPLDGAVTTPSQVDDIFREMMAQVASQVGEMNFEGADIASATTTNLANATGWSLDITGTTTITGLGTVAAGKLYILRFTGVLTLTHNGVSLILPGAGDITTASGDIAWMKSEGSGNWRCVSYQRFGGISTVGPNTSTDNRIVRFNGTGGVIQSSPVTIDDDGNISGVVALTTSGGITSTGGNIQADSSFVGEGNVILATTGANTAFVRPNGFNSTTGQTSFASDGTITSTLDIIGGRAESPTGAVAGIRLTVGSTACSIRSSTTSAASQSHAIYYNTNGLVGSINTSGSATSYATSSDERLKENFTEIDSGGLIDAINVYRFDWKSGGGSAYGVKAQECHMVFPDAITPGSGELGQAGFVPWSADYSKFVPLLLAEVKSLRDRVAVLESE